MRIVGGRIVLSTRRHLHHYFVSACGDLYFIGPSPLMSMRWMLAPTYWAGGDTDTG